MYKGILIYFSGKRLGALKFLDPDQTSMTKWQGVETEFSQIPFSAIQENSEVIDIIENCQVQCSHFITHLIITQIWINSHVVAP